MRDNMKHHDDKMTVDTFTDKWSSISTDSHLINTLWTGTYHQINYTIFSHSTLHKSSNYYYWSISRYLNIFTNWQQNPYLKIVSHWMTTSRLDASYKWRYRVNIKRCSHCSVLSGGLKYWTSCFRTGKWLRWYKSLTAEGDSSKWHEAIQWKSQSVHLKLRSFQCSVVLCAAQ